MNNLYKYNGNTAKMVCDFLGWMFECHPIRVMTRGKIVYATGTVLKPDEWRSLVRHDGESLPDGRTLKITHIPTV